ncbi:MAG TPA: hypothetical protein VLB80_02670 [Candidatus Babeliales bacterium]|nr:hypothetical protein [Candidatus Babeliales bacterium]
MFIGKFYYMRGLALSLIVLFWTSVLPRVTNIPTQVENRQQPINTPIIPSIEIPTIPASEESIETQTKFTQTEAYFQVPTLRKMVTEEFTGTFEVVRYMNIVSRCMAKEAEFRQGHWAFYHTMSNAWIVWQDTLTKLFNHFNPAEKKGNFTFMRIRGRKVPQEAKEFLLSSLSESGLVDDNNEARGVLLSANLSLFGNTGLGSESSWRYFMKPKQHSEPNQSLYKDVMDEFGVSDVYIQELIALQKLFTTKQQTLLQIFVPKNLIDDIGYLAWATGIPAHQPSIDWVRTNIANRTYKGKAGKPGALWALAGLKDQFKTEQSKNPLFKEMISEVEKGYYSLNDYLNKYCSDPLNVPNMNYVQARLLFADDVLLNPTSGVMMFRHNEVDNKTMKEYENRLNAIVDKIISTKK